MTDIQAVAVQGEVALSASMQGVEDGTQASFEIHKAEDDSVVATVQGEVTGGAAEASWDPDLSPDGDARGVRVYYVVTAGEQTVRSPEMEVYLDWVEISSVDEEGNPLPDVPYRLVVGEGEEADERQGTTTSTGTYEEQGLPPGEVTFEWLGPFQLVEWIDDTGPTRKAKLKKVHRLQFLWPSPEGEGGKRAWCDDGTEVELEERFHAHTQWVNLPLDLAKPEQGSILKCRVAGRDRASALRGDKVFVKVERPGPDELSKRDDPVRALKGGGDQPWAQGPTCQGLELTMPADGGEVELEVELGLAGGDQVTIHVGCTDRCDDAKLVVTNRRKIYYQLTRMAHQTMVDLEAGELSTRAWLDAVHVELEAEPELVWSDAPALDGPAYERGVTKAPAAWFEQDAEGERAIVGMHNWEWFKKKFRRDHGALGVQFTLADAIIWGTQRDGETPHTQAFRIDWPTGAPTQDYGQLAGTRQGVPILKKGSTGSAVRALQNALNATGATLDVDGDFQDATEEAVRSFQEAHGLEKIDGKVGPETMGALDAELGVEPIFRHFVFLPNQRRFEMFPQALHDGGAPARQLTWRVPNRRNVPAAWRDKTGPVDPAWVKVDRFAPKEERELEDGTKVPVVEGPKGIFIEFPEDSEPGRAIAALAPVSVRGTLYPGETGRLGSSQAFQIVLTDVPDATLQNLIITHELGHNMRQAAVRDTDLTGAENRNLYLPPAFEFSDHPMGYRGHGHVGPHCYFGLDDGGATHVKRRKDDGSIEYVAMEGAASEQEEYGRLYKDDGGGVYSWVSGTCVMFGAADASTAGGCIGFCEHCAPFVQAQSMHDLHKDSDVAALNTADDAGGETEQTEDEDEAFTPEVLRMQLLLDDLSPAANAPYELTFASGAKVTGTTDAAGRLEQEVEPEDGDVTVSYTPQGASEPIVLTVTWRPSLDATSDDHYLDQLRCWGYALQDEPRADSLTRFQGAYGLDLTGQLDDATKDAIDGLLSQAAEQDDALRSRLKTQVEV